VAGDVRLDPNKDVVPGAGAKLAPKGVAAGPAENGYLAAVLVPN